MGKDFMAAGNVDAFDFGAVEERMSQRNDRLRGGRDAVDVDAGSVPESPDEATTSTPDAQNVCASYTPGAQDTSSAPSPLPSGHVPSPATKGKRRVNVSLSRDVHDEMKRVAAKYGTNVSELCLNGWLAIRDRYGL